eukprot:TRINITY_DN61550_c0_g1_i1.p1 TRINITY_DN61550_c0_g1~~TRINITY_DN61550_c0_g1_i1.p1  ORF type:complete len:1240 (-),score=168.71 TRINITY_DN61550_c0_g1_i1:3-3692(-)
MGSGASTPKTKDEITVAWVKTHDFAMLKEATGKETPEEVAEALTEMEADELKELCSLWEEHQELKKMLTRKARAGRTGIPSSVVKDPTMTEPPKHDLSSHDFELFDTNGDGIIDTKEWVSAFGTRQGFNQLDGDRDGQISPEEFNKCRGFFDYKGSDEKDRAYAALFETIKQLNHPEWASDTPAVHNSRHNEFPGLVPWATGKHADNNMMMAMEQAWAGDGVNDSELRRILKNGQRSEPYVRGSTDPRIVGATEILLKAQELGSRTLVASALDKRAQICWEVALEDPVSPATVLLWYACYTGATAARNLPWVDQSNRVESLLKSGASPNVENYPYSHHHWFERTRGSTALHYAVTAGHEDVVKVLLAHPGIDVNIQSGSLRTALHFAAARGNTSMARLLLGARADPNIRNDCNETPAMEAGSQENRWFELQAELQAAEDPVLQDRARDAFWEENAVRERYPGGLWWSRSLEISNPFMQHNDCVGENPRPSSLPNLMPVGSCTKGADLLTGCLKPGDDFFLPQAKLPGMPSKENFGFAEMTEALQFHQHERACAGLPLWRWTGGESDVSPVRDEGEKRAGVAFSAKHVLTDCHAATNMYGHGYSNRMPGAFEFCMDKTVGDPGQWHYSVNSGFFHERPQVYEYPQPSSRHDWLCRVFVWPPPGYTHLFGNYVGECGPISIDYGGCEGYLNTPGWGHPVLVSLTQKADQRRFKDMHISSIRAFNAHTPPEGLNLPHWMLQGRRGRMHLSNKGNYPKSSEIRFEVEIVLGPEAGGFTNEVLHLEWSFFTDGPRRFNIKHAAETANAWDTLRFALQWPAAVRSDNLQYDNQGPVILEFDQEPLVIELPAGEFYLDVVRPVVVGQAMSAAAPFPEKKGKILSKKILDNTIPLMSSWMPSRVIFRGQGAGKTILVHTAPGPALDANSNFKDRYTGKVYNGSEITYDALTFVCTSKTATHQAGGKKQLVNGAELTHDAEYAGLAKRGLSLPGTGQKSGPISAEEAETLHAKKSKSVKDAEYLKYLETYEGKYSLGSNDFAHVRLHRKRKCLVWQQFWGGPGPHVEYTIEERAYMKDHGEDDDEEEKGVFYFDEGISGLWPAHIEHGPAKIVFKGRSPPESLTHLYSAYMKWVRGDLPRGLRPMAGDSALKEDVSDPKEAGEEQPIIWEFSVRSGFKAFDSEVQGHVEKQYQAFRAGRGSGVGRVPAGDKIILVDFTNMKQTIEGSTRQRVVRRRDT